MITNTVLLLLITTGALCVILETLSAFRVHQQGKAIKVLAQDMINATLGLQSLYAQLSEQDKLKCDEEFKKRVEEFNNKSKG